MNGYYVTVLMGMIMSTKKYEEPGIFSFEKSLRPFVFPVIKSVPCDFKGELPPRDFLDVLNSRKSERAFSPMDLPDLGQLFFHASRTKDMFVHTCGSLLEKRNYASPGSLYSVQSLVSELSGQAWYAYNSLARSFDLINLDSQIIRDFKHTCSRLLPDTRNAWLIWYVCDYDLVCSRYTHPDTLVFREAGHLSATHALVAEYLGLAYCPLGYHGYQEAMEISAERKFVGVGLALLGART